MAQGRWTGGWAMVAERFGGGAGGSGGGIRGGGGDNGGLSLAEFPELLFVPDLARLLQITPRALRQRAARGQVPAPMRLGKALAWTRGSVASWLRDCGRPERPTAMYPSNVLRLVDASPVRYTGSACPPSDTRRKTLAASLC